MPILAISVTTIECDGTEGTPCPRAAVVEFPHPQGVAIRLAKNSGWTVWIETTCPVCSMVPSTAAFTAPAAPVMLTVKLDRPLDDLTRWCGDMTGQMPLMQVG